MNEDHVLFRKVKDDTADINYLWTLRNAPRCRSVSLDTKHIAWVDHCEWFEKKFADKLSAMFVLTIPSCSGIRIGYGILSGIDLSSAKISYAVGQVSVHQGYGTYIVKQLCLHAQELLFLHVEAYVRVGNIASIRVLVKNGFTDFARYDSGLFKYIKHL